MRGHSAARIARSSGGRKSKLPAPRPLYCRASADKDEKQGDSNPAKKGVSGAKFIDLREERAASVEGSFVDDGERLTWVDGHAVFMQGVRAGERLDKVPVEYLKRIAWRGPGWGPGTNRILQDALHGKFPEPPLLQEEL